MGHGTLYGWLERGAARGPVLLALDIDALADAPPSGGGGGGGGEEGGLEGEEEEEGEEEGGADMRWLSAAQPAGANLVVASSHPAALRTARGVYMWPVIEMGPLGPAEAEALVRLPSHPYPFPISPPTPPQR